MKYSRFASQTLTILNTILLFLSFAITAKANPQIKSLTQDETFVTENMMIAQSITGGWSKVANDNPDVKKAAQKAISLQADKIDESLELLSIENAKRQVVAGMNYELKLKVSRNGQETMALVTIWAKLDGSYELSEWWWKG